MIFGFNTDVKHDETVYHVQSEARKAELLLQTQVFVKGRCIGKRATSYAGLVADPTFSDEHMHELLRTQHKAIVEAIRGGTILAEIFANTDVQDVNGQGLAVAWVNSNAVFAEGCVVMRFMVNDQAIAAAGAKVTARFDLHDQAPIYSQATTDAIGQAEMKFFVDEETLSEASVLVQAIAGDKSATRKFVLRKSAAVRPA